MSDENDEKSKDGALTDNMKMSTADGGCFKKSLRDRSKEASINLKE